MSLGDVEQDGMRPVVVRVPVEPVEAAMEADAVEAAVRAGSVAVRGPLFGIATQSADDGPRWRVMVPLSEGCPQRARDSLNSRLWFRAKDDAKDRAERRALLAAVARLESEPVDELTVLGTRYRVVRAEEYAGMGADGIEQPRPTDPEPLVPDWDGAGRDKVDEDLVLDPDAPLTPAQAAERLALRRLAYTGSRFPEEVREDAHRALRTHPDVLLLPAVFSLVEKSAVGWRPLSGPHATPHDARRSLDFSLLWFEPRKRGLIPMDADRFVDARTVVAEDPEAADAELAAYAEAAGRLRAGRTNQLEALGRLYRIGRTRRLVRWGADGPEGPRPSDISDDEPSRLHPRLDEDGVIHYDESDQAPD